MDNIDFVITWIDDTDIQWRLERQKYLNNLSCAKETGLQQGMNQSDKGANGDCRYRSDAELLRYWFRGVESFAPWVNKVYFVTCGQKPVWLNDHHPKLQLVNHNDYIPSKYLPTFNSNTIELNFHRIPGLSEHFVLFNDDMYLLQHASPDFFFKDGNPVLATDLRYPINVNYNNWSRIAFNDYCIVNKCFDMRESIWHNRKKWFCIKELGVKRSRQNLLCYLANKTLPIGDYGHIGIPHLKSTFKDIWTERYDVLDISCNHRFRSDDQVNHWICCAWNQANGRFYPANGTKLGSKIVITPHNVDYVCYLITHQAVPQICPNDTKYNTDYILSNERLIQAFNCILPQKSSFEI